MSERTRVEYLVTISQGELADKTMRSFHQRLRLDLVDQPGMPLRSQVVLDRQHVVPALRKKSYPAAYLTFSKHESLFHLAKTFYAAGFAKLMDGRPDLDAEKYLEEELRDAVNDIMLIMDLYQDELHRHRRAQSQREVVVQ